MGLAVQTASRSHAVTHRVSGSSVVKASDLELGGSWVRIPSGVQIFSESPYGRSPLCYFLLRIFCCISSMVTEIIAEFSNRSS